MRSRSKNNPAEGFVAYCLDLLAPAGVATARAMFGGHGLRIDGLFIGLVAFEQLYLKVDALSRPQFEAASCRPFVYEGKGRPITMSYWTVPPQAMDSPEAMRPWVRLALEAALRAKADASAASQPAKRRAPRRG